MVVKPPNARLPKGVGNNADDLVAARPSRTSTALTAEEIAASQMEVPGGAIGAAENLVGYGSNMYLFAGGAALGGIGNIISRNAQGRGWTGLEKLGNVMAAPSRAYSYHSFGSIGKKLGVADIFRGLTRPVFGILGSLSHAIGSMTGLSAWRMAAHERKIPQAFNSAKEAAAALDLTHVNGGIGNALREIQASIVSATDPVHLDLARIRDARASLNAQMRAQGTVTKELKSLVSSAGHIAEQATYHVQKAHDYKDLRKAWKSMPERISKASVGPGIMQGSIVALSMFSIADDTKSFSSRLATLRQMHADLTGEKNVSTAKLLFGTVPATVAHTRKALLANFGIKQLLDIVNIGLNIKMNRIGMLTSLLAFGGVQELSKRVDSIADTSVLPFYTGMSEAHQKKQNISAEAYAEFLTLASEELSKSGKDNPMVQKLAEQYAAQQIAPAALIKEIECGEMSKRVKKIIADNAAKAPEKVTEEPKAPAAKDKLWTEQLAAKSEKKLQKPEMERMQSSVAVGAYTAKENAKAATVQNTAEIIRGA